MPQPQVKTHEYTFTCVGAGRQPSGNSHGTTVTHVYAQIHSQSAQSLTLTHFNTASLVAKTDKSLISS